MFEITKIFKKFSTKINIPDILAIFSFSALYFFTRIPNLLRLPIFSDEGIYINWAQIATINPAERLISLTDGKQPLQTLLTIPFIKVFPDNLLLAGRLMAVFGGFFAFLGIIILSRLLWGRLSSYITAIFALTLPYFFFYDRLALVESSLNASLIWIFIFTLLLAKYHRLDIALLLGLIGSTALLAKSSANLFLILGFMGFLLGINKIHSFKSTFLSKLSIEKTINYVFLYSIGFILAYTFSQIQRFSPNYFMIARKNTTFILSFAEFLEKPFQLLKVNLTLVPMYIAHESGWIVPIIAIFGLIILYKKDFGKGLYFTILLVVPYLLVAGFNRVLFPRYLIFFASYLTLLASYFMTIILRNKFYKLGFLVAILYFYFAIPFLYAGHFNPKNLSLPAIDKGQYVEGITAVWGANELMEYARKISQERPVIILAEGNFGLVADVLRVFIRRDDKIQIQGLWPLNLEDVRSYQNEATKSAVLIAFSHRTEFSTEWPMKIIQKYTKPNSSDALYLYEVVPSVNPVIPN